MRVWPFLLVTLEFIAFVGGNHVGFHYRHDLHYELGAPTIAAVSFLAIGYFITKLSPLSRDVGYVRMCGVSLVYAIGLMVLDPFFEFGQIGTESLGFCAVGLMLPFAFLFEPHLRRRNWCAVAGVTLFVFLCNAILAGNIGNNAWGFGFFGDAGIRS